VIKIAHRINTIDKLKKIPQEWGVEIDVRHDNRTGKLYLNHDPGSGEYLEKYLKYFSHRFIIFNIKEVGIENHCVNLAAKFNIPKNNYFLLDVEFPYLYRAALNNGMQQIAVRYSEAEPIEAALKFKNLVDWVWIDVNTKLPLDANVKRKLSGFKTCLVSPECWGRPDDIAVYRQKIEKLNFQLDAVMVDFKYGKLWE
jgi:hypothetical protein